MELGPDPQRGKEADPLQGLCLASTASPRDLRSLQAAEWEGAIPAPGSVNPTSSVNWIFSLHRRGHNEMMKQNAWTSSLDLWPGKVSQEQRKRLAVHGSQQ